MNRRCENNIADHAVNVCDSCYGEFCDDCLVQLKTRKHPLCTECAVITSGVRGNVKPPVRGEKRTARKRRKEIAVAVAELQAEELAAQDEGLDVFTPEAVIEQPVEEQIEVVEEVVVEEPEPEVEVEEAPAVEEADSAASIEEDYTQAPSFDIEHNMSRLSADFIRRQIEQSYETELEAEPEASLEDPNIGLAADDEQVELQRSERADKIDEILQAQETEQIVETQQIDEVVEVQDDTEWPEQDFEPDLQTELETEATQVVDQEEFKEVTIGELLSSNVTETEATTELDEAEIEVVADQEVAELPKRNRFGFKRKSKDTEQEDLAPLDETGQAENYEILDSAEVNKDIDADIAHEPIQSEKETTEEADPVEVDFDETEAPALDEDVASENNYEVEVTEDEQPEPVSLDDISEEADSDPDEQIEILVEEPVADEQKTESIPDELLVEQEVETAEEVEPDAIAIPAALAGPAEELDPVAQFLGLSDGPEDEAEALQHDELQEEPIAETDLVVEDFDQTVDSLEEEVELVLEEEPALDVEPELVEDEIESQESSFEEIFSQPFDSEEPIEFIEQSEQVPAVDESESAEATTDELFEEFMAEDVDEHPFTESFDEPDQSLAEAAIDPISAIYGRSAELSVPSEDLEPLEQEPEVTVADLLDSGEAQVTVADLVLPEHNLSDDNGAEDSEDTEDELLSEARESLTKRRGLFGKKSAERKSQEDPVAEIDFDDLKRVAETDTSLEEPAIELDEADTGAEVDAAEEILNQTQDDLLDAEVASLETEEVGVEPMEAVKAEPKPRRNWLGRRKSTPVNAEDALVEVTSPESIEHDESRTDDSVDDLVTIGTFNESADHDDTSLAAPDEQDTSEADELVHLGLGMSEDLSGAEDDSGVELMESGVVTFQLRPEDGPEETAETDSEEQTEPEFIFFEVEENDHEEAETEPVGEVIQEIETGNTGSYENVPEALRPKGIKQDGFTGTPTTPAEFRLARRSTDKEIPETTVWVKAAAHSEA